MAAWEERGFVPDTDDEDEDFLDVKDEAGPGPRDDEGDLVLEDAGLSAAEKPSRQQNTIYIDCPRPTDEDGSTTFHETSQTDQAIVDNDTLDEDADEDKDGEYWKSKGEVTTERNELQPDQLTQNDKISIELPVSFVAAQLQAQLESGLSIVQDVLSSPRPAEENVDIFGPPSSPLSPARSLPDPDADGSRVCTELDHSVSPSRRRNLRERNAIQKHPYQLEHARYEQAMINRGLKPLSMVAFQVQRSDTRTRQHYDELEHRDPEDDYDLHSDSGPNSIDLTKPTAAAFAPRKSPVKRVHNEVLGDEEELPDLEDILGSKLDSSPPVRSQLRRRRPLQNRKLVGPDEEIGFDDMLRVRPHPAAETGLANSSFQNPPSPAYSFNFASSPSDEDSRNPATNLLPNRATPKTLPTPATSSTLNSVKESDHQLEHVVYSEHTDSSDASNLGSPRIITEYEDSQIGRFQRKIRGTLPASFMRLQGQSKKPVQMEKRRPSPSMDREIEGPGVAQRSTRPRLDQELSQMSTHNAYLISDDSSSEDDAAIAHRGSPPEPMLPPIGDFDMDMFEGDAEEDNRIDAMAPSLSRKRRSSKPSRKRQVRIDDPSMERRKPRQYDEMSRKRLGGHSNRGPSDTGRPKHSKRSLRPRIRSPNVLDSPGYTQLPRDRQPMFLRVAARRAKSVHKRTREAPSQKFIDLTRGETTGESSMNLINWNRPSTERRERFNIESKIQPLGSEEDRVGHMTSNAITQWDSASEPSAADNLSDQVELLEGGLACGDPTQPRSHDTAGIIQDILQRQKTHLPPRTNGLVAKAQYGKNRGPLFRSAQMRFMHQNRSGQGVMQSSTIGTARSREAQLESVAPSKPRRKIVNTSWTQALTVDGKFDPVANSGIPTPPRFIDEVSVSPPAVPVVSAVITRQHRKNQTPRHLNVESSDRPWKPMASISIAEIECDIQEPLSGIVLTGLGSPEFPMSYVSGVIPFTDGFRVAESSMVGHGLLSSLLHDFVEAPRDMMGSSQSISIVIRPSSTGSPFRWHKWNDQTALEFSAWFTELKTILAAPQQPSNPGPSNSMLQIQAPFASLLSYLSTTIHFDDLASLTAFADLVISLIEDLVAKLEETFLSGDSAIVSTVLDKSSLMLAFTFAIGSILSLTPLDYTFQARVCHSYKSIALRVLGAVFQERLKASTVSGTSQMGQRDSQIESLIIINHLTRPQKAGFEVWDLIAEALFSTIGTAPEDVITFYDYDCWWKLIFAVVPILELNVFGTPDRKSGSSCWDLVQRLLNRFMLLYMPRRQKTGYSSKKYGRILLHHCLELAQTWGWQGGHLALGIILDAYNSNDFNEVFGETANEKYGIIERVYSSPAVHASEEDSGFHVFLTLLASTIQNCYRSGTDSKLAKRVLRSLSARVTPSKSRDLPRSMIPSAQDILALRNRFDLGSVMYCTMAADMRPGIQLLQSFVDFQVSHREACKAALDCWSELLQYELLPERNSIEPYERVSGDQPQGQLLILQEWQNKMGRDLINQLELTEYGSLGITEQRNLYHDEQRHILSDMRKPLLETLMDVLRSFERTFSFSSTAAQATTFLGPNILERALKIFDPKDSSSCSLGSAVLDVISAYALKCVPKSVFSVQPDDDSQQYGSWDHFDGMETGDADDREGVEPSWNSSLQAVMSMLFQFVSTVFGDDTIPDPITLKHTTDCWFIVSDALIRSRTRSCDDFVGLYSSLSWESLRQTLQAQQYKIYFLSMVIEEHASYYEENRLRFLDPWLSAICRPAGQFRWEHLLTATILYQDPDNELLFNAPFTVRLDAGKRAQITMSEFLRLRHRLVYGVLRNMHRLVAAPAISSQSSFACTKTELSEALKHAESTMKTCYHDLEGLSEAQAEYRVFLDYVAQQMQLYVEDFHKIDPFLLDPAISCAESCKLATTLKRYSFNIQRTGVTKSMVLFLYNACERTAVDDAQGDLITQTQRAFLDLSQDAIEAEESHDNDLALLSLSLRHVLPAFLSNSLDGPGMLIAEPVIRMLAHVFANLRCRSDLWNAPAMVEVLSSMKVLLSAIKIAFAKTQIDAIFNDYRRLENFNGLVEIVHTAMLRCYEASEDFPEIIDPGDIMDLLCSLKSLISGIVPLPDLEPKYLISPDNDENSALQSPSPQPEQSDIATYTQQELASIFAKSWRQNGLNEWEIVGRGRPKLVQASRNTLTAAATVARLEQCQQRARMVVSNFVEAFWSLDWWE